MKTTIELARAAGFESIPDCVWVENTDVTEMLERFAALVREDYRAELLAGSGEPVAWLVTHGEDLFATEDRGYARDFPQDEVEPLHTADQLAAAVLREREKAAGVCEGFDVCDPKHIAAAIRAGETK